MGDHSFFDTSAVAIITGASKGIGRAIAEEFAKRFSGKLLLILTGRAEKDLQETASCIQADSRFSLNKITIRIVVGDLADQVGFPDLVGRLYKDIDVSQYQHAVLVNNAGSPGDVTKYVKDMNTSDTQTIQDYFFLNVSAPLLLASKFLSTFPGNGINSPARRTIVQISSVAATNSTPSWSLYCTGKAARDMLHGVIAKEEPGVRVLNYGPGPVDTAMFCYGKTHSASQETTKMMQALAAVAVTAQRTAGVLCDILKDNKYDSGNHVELFDVIGHPKHD